MNITNSYNSSVSGMLANIYNPNAQPPNAQATPIKDNEQGLNGVDSIHKQDKSLSLQPVDVNKRIEDKFSPSVELQKAKEIGGELEGGFNDKALFENLASTLKREGIINSNEKVAMNYLKNNSSKLSFDEFEKIAANDNHSKEMKGLLDSVIHKMKFVNEVNGGIF